MDILLLSRDILNVESTWKYSTDHSLFTELKSLVLFTWYLILNFWKYKGLCVECQLKCDLKEFSANQMILAKNGCINMVIKLLLVLVCKAGKGWIFVFQGGGAGLRGGIIVQYQVKLGKIGQFCRMLHRNFFKSHLKGNCTAKKTMIFLWSIESIHENMRNKKPEIKSLFRSRSGTFVFYCDNISGKKPFLLYISPLKCNLWNSIFFDSLIGPKLLYFVK